MGNKQAAGLLQPSVRLKLLSCSSERLNASVRASKTPACAEKGIFTGTERLPVLNGGGGRRNRLNIYEVRRLVPKICEATEELRGRPELIPS